MANIVEKLREVKFSTEKKRKRELCVRHEEKLLPFCKEDGKVICWVCEWSQQHRGHHMFLMEEVGQEYQVREQDGDKTQHKMKLQSALERLREEQQEAEELEAYEVLKLKNEVSNILHNLTKGKKELVQQSQLVRALISEVEHRLQGSRMKMLQVRLGKKPQLLRYEKNEDWSIFVIPSSETLTLKKPKTLPMEQRRVFQATDLRGILRVFNVYVILDPSTYKSNVFISGYRRQVRYMPYFT
ncbi:hypothetical protein HPG69_005759 [Diceros bicornis minor]|uniref:B box-type domain-containing protein n=1 Tax=Diceros bicornis minor TaxID=77932 RepID=A0A7J7ESR0_DICBM|nr:hypothetical protein HPG69_005759 [Diceros bicornis minor]